LREIGQWLVDVHGQSEHLSLLRVPEHINLLDRFAQIGDLLDEYSREYQTLHQLKAELEALRQSEQDSAQRAELLAYQVNEIESANLEPGEDKNLTEERNRLVNAEHLAEYAQQAILALDDELDEDTSAVDLLGKVLTALTGLAKVDPSTEADLQSATDLFEASNDLVHRLRNYIEQIEFSPDRLNEVEERLEMIRGLKRKYGEDFAEINAYAKRTIGELESITNAEERIDQLEELVEVQVKALGEIGIKISGERREASNRLSEGIDHELSDLKMTGAKFDVAQDWFEDENGVDLEDRKVSFRPSGIDRIEFLVAPNPGEGLKPLAKITSQNRLRW
jgi:DNA repair protein RecN (Recombination protein N)